MLAHAKSSDEAEERLQTLQTRGHTEASFVHQHNLLQLPRTCYVGNANMSNVFEII